MNKLRFYEGGYLFYSVETELNIAEDFVLMKLSEQYEYRPTKETLWAEVVIDDAITRYSLDYSNIRLNKVNY